MPWQADDPPSPKSVVWWLIGFFALGLFGVLDAAYPTIAGWIFFGAILLFAIGVIVIARTQYGALKSPPADE